jgi:hypothetical protein
MWMVSLQQCYLKRGPYRLKTSREAAIHCFLHANGIEFVSEILSILPRSLNQSKYQEQFSDLI